MRWRFCPKHDRRIVFTSALVLGYCALALASHERPPSRIRPTAFWLGIVVPLAVWLTKQLPRRARTFVMRAVVVMWVLTGVTLLFVVTRPDDFVRVLRAFR